MVKLFTFQTKLKSIDLEKVQDLKEFLEDCEKDLVVESSTNARSINFYIHKIDRK